MRWTVGGRLYARGVRWEEGGASGGRVPVGKQAEVFGKLEDDEGELATAREEKRNTDCLGARQSKGKGSEREEEPELGCEKCHDA